MALITLGSKSLHMHTSPKSSVYIRTLCQSKVREGLRREYICFPKMMVWYDLDLETSFKDTLHQRLFVGEVLARLDQGERMNDPDDDFSDNSAMTITIVQT